MLRADGYSLRKIKDHPKRSIAILAYVVLTPLLIGLLAGLLNRRKSTNTSNTSNIASSDSHNSTSTAHSSALSLAAASSASAAVSASAVRFSLVRSHATSSSSHATKASALVVAQAIATSTYKPSLDATACFPLGSAAFASSGAKPSLSRANWWCDSSLLYGFLGFSYPVEAADCSDPTNGYAAISADMATMKSFGATMVRVYAPECRDISIWENLLQAGMDNGMGVIPMVWWGFLSDVSRFSFATRGSAPTRL